jgi:hypothetical protein
MVDARDFGGIVVNNPNQRTRLLGFDLNLLGQLSAQAGDDHIVVAGRGVPLVDVPPDPERVLIVQPALGLPLRPAHQQITVTMSNHYVGDDLLAAEIVLRHRARDKAAVGQNGGRHAFAFPRKRPETQPLHDLARDDQH